MSDWSEMNRRAELEEDAREKARQNNPGLKVKFQKKIVTDDIFGFIWISKKFKKLREKMKKKAQLLLLLLLPLIQVSCAGVTATGPDGSKFTAVNVGGKQMMAGVRSPAVEIDQYYTDTEAAFKHLASMAAIMYSVNQVAGAFEAFQGEKTARHAADAVTSQKATEAATTLKGTELKAGLIEKVGVPGEVPIGPINLP